VVPNAMVFKPKIRQGSCIYQVCEAGVEAVESMSTSSDGRAVLRENSESCWLQKFCEPFAGSREKWRENIRLSLLQRK
jgi:hypothetical protein